MMHSSCRQNICKNSDTDIKLVYRQNILIEWNASLFLNFILFHSNTLFIISSSTSIIFRRASISFTFFFRLVQKRKNSIPIERFSNPINFVAIPSTNVSRPTPTSDTRNCYARLRAARWQAERYIAHPPFPARRHPLRSTRLNPHPLTHSPQGGSTAVPRFTDDSVHALRHAVATQRDAIALMGSEKSAGATCPSSVVPRFLLKGSRGRLGTISYNSLQMRCIEKYYIV